MKNFIKLISILALFFFTTAQSNSAEKVKLLETIGALKVFLENLIEGHYKEAIKFILKYVRLAIQ